MESKRDKNLSRLERIRNFPDKTKTALAYLDEPVLITDPSGILIYLNPEAEERFGLELRFSVGRDLSEILPGAIAENLHKGIKQVKRTQKSLKFFIMESNPRYQAHLNPILEKGKLSGVIIFLCSESEQELIQRLNQSLFENLLDEVYHPLNSLTLLVSRELEDYKEFNKLYNNFQGLVKKTILALNNLIDFSPVLVGEIKLARNKFQPTLLLKLAIRSFRARAESKKLYLMRLNHIEPDEVLGDQAKLNRVLVIFLDYILALAPKGAIIALSTDLRMAPGPMLIYSISVTDLVKSEKDFYCLSGELSPEYSKLCVEDKQKERNLVAASRLLLAMKGGAQVASLEGVGTTLSFSVPVTLSEKEPESAESESIS